MAIKQALVIGNTQYQDPRLAELTSPSADVKALSGVLEAPGIGSFAVQTMVDQPEAVLRRAIAVFFSGDRNRDDILLLYFSGHGVLDEKGELFLAVKDSDSRYLNGTALPATFISDAMDRCPSRRLVLILDCCHSGAFGRGAKGAPGTSIGIGNAFVGNGSARVVLTATNSTQYAWEGSQVTGHAESSVFTKYLVAGLQTGAADEDGDGQITVDELYNYVHDHVVDETPKQEPNKFVYQQQGRLVLAQAPARAAELPADLQEAIRSPYPGVRVGAVDELARLNQAESAGLAALALAELQKLALDDSRQVAAAAQAVIEKEVPREVVPEGGGGGGGPDPTRAWPAWLRPLTAAVVVLAALLGLLGAGWSLWPWIFPPTPSSTRGAGISVVVPGTVSWTDTKVDVIVGRQLTIHGDGQVQHNTAVPAVSPDGDSNPGLRTFSVLPSAGHGALIGRIGLQGSPFPVGKSFSKPAGASGRLFLGINDLGVENNSGSFTAKIELP